MFKYYNNTLKHRIIMNILTEIKKRLFSCTPNQTSPARLLGNPLVTAAAGAAFGAIAATTSLKTNTKIALLGTISVLSIGIAGIQHKTHSQNTPINQPHSDELEYDTRFNEDNLKTALNQWVAKSDGLQESARKTAAERILQCYLTKNPCLDLSNLNLTSLPDIFEIFGESLTSLNLTRNELQQIPDRIDILKNLRVLTLSFNPIISIPETIDRLQNLECLLLIETPLLFLPTSIKHMPNLICHWNLGESDTFLTHRRESWLDIAQKVLVHGPNYEIFTIGGEQFCTGVSPYPKRFPHCETPLIQQQTKAQPPTKEAPPRNQNYDHIETYFDNT